MAPEFDDRFRAKFDELMRWRRDVRRFELRAVPEAVMAQILASLDAAPSVGLSQPWRVVRVESPAARSAVIENFTAANAAALKAQLEDDSSGERGHSYARLKLAGLETAPEQLAVLVEPDPDQGHGLGRRTMPEMVHASAGCAIMQMWLVARAWGIGLGWVSILDPARLKHDLSLDPSWQLVAYLCLGFPADQSDTPELERANWDVRRPQLPAVLVR